MTLGEGKDGEWFVVTMTQGDEITMQALRFGIATGARIQVQKNIRGGPVIVSKNQLEIAIGRQLADFIHVEPVARG
jgi:Fe2+ transport system protein FeoA